MFQSCNSLSPTIWWHISLLNSLWQEIWSLSSNCYLILSCHQLPLTSYHQAVSLSLDYLLWFLFTSSFTIFTSIFQLPFLPSGPRWASWNLGIFLCIRCAGIHRNLGVHISKVKSVNLDAWTPEQVGYLQQMGNSKARAVYEANLPDNFRRPQTDSSLEAFVRAKYEQKKYIAKEWVQPPTPQPAVRITCVSNNLNTSLSQPNLYPSIHNKFPWRTLSIFLHVMTLVSPLHHYQSQMMIESNT